MQPAPTAPQAAPADRTRFGINSLINRMTGGQAGPAQAAERAMPSARQQPRLSAEFDDEQATDPDKERIEIPAFLRRQAN